MPKNDAPKYTTLYKGELKRRVASPAERRQLLSSGWSETAPKKAATAKPATKPDSK